MKKINYIDSIRNPIVTEKATILSEQNKTVFRVHEKANKKIIKRNIGGISKLSSERLMDEFKKLTKSEGFLKLFKDKNNYSLIEIKGKNLPHSFANRNQLRSIA